MTLRLFLALIFVLIAGPAFAGSVSDTDGDLVPDAYDNCTDVANGPNETSNQIDTNLDGYGNACDGDFNNDGGTTTADFTGAPTDITFLNSFTGVNVSLDTDMDGNGATTTADFLLWLAFFSNGNAPAGPSGLACAGTIPCIP